MSNFKIKAGKTYYTVGGEKVEIVGKASNPFRYCEKEFPFIGVTAKAGGGFVAHYSEEGTPHHSVPNYCLLPNVTKKNGYTIIWFNEDKSYPSLKIFDTHQEAHDFLFDKDRVVKGAIAKIEWEEVEDDE